MGRTDPARRRVAPATVSRRRAPSLVSVALALGVIAVGTAGAHTLPVERRCLASVRHESTLRIEVMLWMRLPPGPDVERLRARADVMPRNRRLDPVEAKALADELGAHAVGGFVLKINDLAARPTSAEPSARLESDGALAVAVLLTYVGPASEARLALTLRTEAARASDGHPVRCVAEWSVVPPVTALVRPPYAAPTMGPEVVAPGGRSLELHALVPR